MRRKADLFLQNILPGIGSVLWISALAGVIGQGRRMLNIDGDLGRHLTIGSYILDSGSVPTRDLFSHTMLGQPMVPHEWLSQVIFALAYRIMGLDGVVLTAGVVIATCFGLLYRQSRETAHGVIPALAAVVLAMAASSLHWLTRPHIFTFLMLALWVGILEDMRRGRILRWWRLPLLMVFWANLHGAFIAGFVSWAVYGAGLAWDAFWRRFPKDEGLHGSFWRFYLLGGGSALLVTLLNPSGIGLWSTSLGYVGNRYLVGHTAEYLPPNFHDPSTWPFLLFIGLMVLLPGLQSKRIESGRMLLAAAWMIMSLYSARNLPLFAVVAAPLLACELAGWLIANHHRLKRLTRFFHTDQRLLETDRSMKSFFWPILAAAAFIIAFQSGAKLDFQQQGNAFDEQVFPVEAMNWLEIHPLQGKVFNYFPWGGYLLFRGWPGQRVFIDGQTDFYGESLTRQYEQVLTLSSGWEDVLRQYEVRWAIVPSGSSLASAMRANAWKSVYLDSTAEIFIK